jgi:hypothetical protein
MSAEDLQAKSLDQPDEIRPFAAKGKVDVFVLGDVTVGRGWSRAGIGRSTCSCSRVPTPARPHTPGTFSPAG